MNTSGNNTVKLSLLHPDDLDDLSAYLLQLEPSTQKRFCPHPFGKMELADYYRDADNVTGYIARDEGSDKIIAYAVIRNGYFEHDKARLESYGLVLNEKTDCNFAPSVADAWQGMGIGKQLLDFVLTDLKQRGVNRMILWGGVQKENENAVRYYLKNGFRILGEFLWHGGNYDMALDLHATANAYP